MVEMWSSWLEQSMLWIQQSGWIGWVWFVVLYALSCVFFLLGSVLSFGAGAVYGFWPATILVSLGSIVGAMANFLIARYLVRGWVEKKFSKSRKFRALNHAIAQDGWRILLLTRISPVLPHSLVSCAFGLSAMPFWKYMVISWIGFLPISAAYAYGGAIFGRAAKGGLHQGPHAWAAYSVELIITLVITVWITRIAQKSLRTYAPEVSEPPAQPHQS